MPKNIITHKFSPNAITYIRKEIKKSFSNEVYFGTNLNENGILDYIEVITRGNENSAPALINSSLEFDAVVHNHPSGNLTPSRNDIIIASELGNEAGVGFLIVNNEVNDYYEVVKPIRAEKVEPLDEGDVLYTYTDGGTLSQLIKGYEYRHEQALLAEAIIRAFNSNSNLIAEAGTGIGKSFAYLIPALNWLKQNKTRIVVSTNTINLQQQIIEKDLPLIASAIAPNVTYTLVKGRSNYVCINKVKEALKENSNDPTLGFDDEHASFIRNIDNWLDSTNDGSITDLGFRPRNDLWELVCSDNDTCIHRKCNYIEKCFFYKMKKRLNASQLLVVNHHLLCADIALYSQSGGTFSLLPKYNKVIIDEAHNFEDCASSSFGDSGSKASITKAIFNIHNGKSSRGVTKKSPRINGRGISERIRSILIENVDEMKPEDYSKAIDLADMVVSNVSEIKTVLDDCSKLFYQYCLQNINVKEGNTFKFRITKALSEDESWKVGALPHIRDIANSLLSLIKTMNALYKIFIDTAVDIGFEYEDVAKLATAYIERVKNNFTSLNTVFDYKEDEYIRWVTARITKNGVLIFSWHLTPVSVGKILNELIYKRFESTVLVSATLTINKRFEFFSSRLGFDLISDTKRNFLYLQSPFNYIDNARLYITADAPDSNSPQFNRFISDFILHAMEITGGRTFTLFTAFTSLMNVHQNIELPLKSKNINVLAQTGGVHRNALLDMFKASNNNILLGVDSFWEGVDVVGKNLELVIIPKLPFAVPTDPISEGRYEYVERQGGNAFMDYALPFAVIKFKQGFGRLIRSKNDRGAVVVLDKRLVSKRYGANFIQSLPQTQVISNGTGEVLDDMASFF